MVCLVIHRVLQRYCGFGTSSRRIAVFQYWYQMARLIRIFVIFSMQISECRCLKAWHVCLYYASDFSESFHTPARNMPTQGNRLQCLRREWRHSPSGSLPVPLELNSIGSKTACGQSASVFRYSTRTRSEASNKISHTTYCWDQGSCAAQYRINDHVRYKVCN